MQTKVQESQTDSHGPGSRHSCQIKPQDQISLGCRDLMSSNELPLSTLDPSRPLRCRRWQPPTSASAALMPKAQAGVAALPLLAVLTCLITLFSFVQHSAAQLRWPLQTCPDGCCTVHTPYSKNNCTYRGTQQYRPMRTFEFIN